MRARGGRGGGAGDVLCDGVVLDETRAAVGMGEVREILGEFVQRAFQRATAVNFGPEGPAVFSERSAAPYAMSTRRMPLSSLAIAAWHCAVALQYNFLFGNLLLVFRSAVVR